MMRIDVFACWTSGPPSQHMLYMSEVVDWPDPVSWVVGFEYRITGRFAKAQRFSEMMLSVRSEPDLAVLFPDVAAVGSLAEALEIAATEQGLLLKAIRTEADPLGHADVASTAVGREALGISAWRWERKWSISGFGRGRGTGEAVSLLKGGTDDFSEIPRVAVAWRDGATLKEIEQIAAFVTLTGHYEVPDDSAAHLVASQWGYLRKDAADSSFPEQVELIEAAYARPELRRLYAYTSHWTLRFSTVISTTLDGLPKTEDGEVSINTITLTALGKGKFSVQASLLGSVIAEVHTAEAAVSYAMRYVHPDLGPAVFSSTR